MTAQAIWHPALICIILGGICHVTASHVTFSRHHLDLRNRVMPRRREDIIDRRLNQNARRRLNNGHPNTTLSFSDLDPAFVNSVILSEEHVRCPRARDVIHSRHKIVACPTRYVLEHDVYRFPAVISQATCRCTRCQGPWASSPAKRCTPLFRFTNVMRVVAKTAFGQNVYAEVWEPISYACRCRYRRARYIMPP